MSTLLLNNSAIIQLLESNKIVIVDGGARGSLFTPFDSLNNNILKFIRFEPDANAHFEERSGDIIIPKALWKDRGTININIAVDPYTSSVYEFNTHLQKYIDPFAELRKTDYKAQVESISLDECCQTYNINKIDFIKLDIHGAEYEALKGSINTLKTTLGLLVESWILPIHKEQKLRAHVEVLLYENNFYVFEEFHFKKWIRNSDQFIKEQPVVLDTLYFKDPLLNDDIVNEIDAIKLLGIADLYKHYGFVVQLTEFFKAKGILTSKWAAIIEQHIKSKYRPSIKEVIKRKMSEYFSTKISLGSFK